MAAHVLIVDDEPNLRKVLGAHLQREGYRVTLCADGDAALAQLSSGQVDVVVTDMVMPRRDGLSLLRHVVENQPDLPVILITAHGTIDSAVEALKIGAFDYITKPFDRDELKAVIAKAAASRRAFQRNASPEADRSRYRIIGQSPKLQDIYNVIARVADAPTTVLILGESGTGKELVAGALHAHSRRRTRPFVKVNCGAIPHDLIETELFGHERGAFTGAIATKPGRFELADGGTLFLDEIGDLPPDMQVKLLRVLQEGEFERVGGIRTLRVDVRVVAATSRDLKAAMAEGRFREDLYYRLAVVRMDLPPLRERRDDIPLLLEHFLDKQNRKLGRSVARFTPAALDRLQAYDWPGNIRELENAVERALLFCDQGDIDLQHLPDHIAQLGQESGSFVTDPPPTRAAELPAGTVDAKEFVEQRSTEAWRELLTTKLAETGGNITQTARLLGITRRTIQLKMKELGLRGDSPADDADDEAGDSQPPAPRTATGV